MSNTVEPSDDEIKDLFSLANNPPFDDHVNHQAKITDLNITLWVISTKVSKPFCAGWQMRIRTVGKIWQTLSGKFDGVKAAWGNIEAGCWSIKFQYPASMQSHNLCCHPFRQSCRWNRIFYLWWTPSSCRFSCTVTYFWLRLCGLSGSVICSWPDSNKGLR